MRWRALSLIAGIAGLATPAVAHACELYFNSIFHAIPSKLTVGAGLQFVPGEDGGPSSQVFSGDLALKLGSKAVAKLGAGLCREGAAEGEEDFSEPIFGGALGFNFWNNAAGTLALNAQVGVGRVSSGEGDVTASYMSIPVGAAGQYKASEKASIYFGVAMLIQKEKLEGAGGFDFDESDSDPLVFGGLALSLDKCTLIGGLALKGDSDFAFNVALRIPAR